MQTDVCIIGAGPAGLMAALAAAAEGARVVLIERNTTAGRKLLRTGRGRCNFTHDGSVEEVLRAFGKNGRFLRHSFYEFGPQAVRQWFADRGVPAKVEADGSVFPASDRATDICGVLLDEAKAAGVLFLYGKRVERVEKQPQGFAVYAGSKEILCRTVIVATGGLSWPHLGSTGDGLKIAASLGHNINDPAACLVPLVTMEKWCGELAGVGVGKVRLTARVEKERIRTEGEMLFTQDGIGGPAVLDLSRRLADVLAEGRIVEVAVDLLPGRNEEEVDTMLVRMTATGGKKEVPHILAGLFARSFAARLCRMADIAPAATGSGLAASKRRRLARLLKALPLTIAAARPLSEGTVTRGGVRLEEIDAKTMESRVCGGLYFAGEVLDIDGPCGGYNLQIAWSTGRLAGRSAAGRNRTVD